MPITITREAFKRFAPKANRAYVTVLFDSGLAVLGGAGILDTKERWAHFIGQCAAETDGFTILRESLDYRSVRAIRNAWPARSRGLDDSWIKEHLLSNPVGLGDWAYGGRMGNQKGGTDGFAFRGGGWMQTTGADAARAYCKRCDVPFGPEVLDDPEITLKFAVAEWVDGGCNAYADKCDVLSIARIINTGSARSGVTPNGMDRRRQETARALDIWDDAGEQVVSISTIQPRAFPEVEPPHPIVVARQSRSVWSLLAAGVAYGLQRIEDVFHMLPNVGADIDSALAPIQSIGHHLKLNIDAISAAVVMTLLGVAVVRHVRDKRELTSLKGEGGDGR